MSYFVEYRDLTEGETVRFETDNLRTARDVREAVQYRRDAVLIASDVFRPCPGYGEDCGTPTEDYLCGDCTTARLDAQSPRIPV